MYGIRLKSRRMVTVAEGFPLIFLSNVTNGFPFSSTNAHLDFQKLSLLNSRWAFVDRKSTRLNSSHR